jgi:hypothetical protein
MLDGCSEKSNIKKENERERERERGREGRRENIETQAASIHPLVNVNHESIFHGTN